MSSKTFKTLFLTCLFSVMAIAAFASGASDNSPTIYFTASTLSSGADVLPITISTPQSILDWFNNAGVDTSTQELTQMSISTRNQIKALYSANKSTIDSIASKELQKYLKKGSAETVSTTFGPIKWSVEYDQDDENDFTLD